MAAYDCDGHRATFFRELPVGAANVRFSASIERRLAQLPTALRDVHALDARYLAMSGKRRLVGSLVHGSMANAMPQAIGIQAAQPRRQVISLLGDGGFTMLMGDLITLKQHKPPVKIVISTMACSASSPLK